VSTLFYRLINPAVKGLLRSSAHGLMSSNTLLLQFTGRKSGRALSTPISYHLSEQAAHCFTSRSFSWWRNLVSEQKVHLTIQGQRLQSTPHVEISDHELMGLRLDEFLKAVPRDASHAGVKMDKDGNPDPADIRRVVPDMVYLRFPLEANNG